MYMAFLRTILIIIIVVYILKLIGRYVIPLLIKRQINKFQQENNRYSNYKQKPEGEVTVETDSKQNKRFNSDEGEYVDYEEIN